MAATSRSLNSATSSQSLTLIRASSSAHRNADKGNADMRVYTSLEITLGAAVASSAGVAAAKAHTHPKKEGFQSSHQHRVARLTPIYPTRNMPIELSSIVPGATGAASDTADAADSTTTPRGRDASSTSGDHVPCRTVGDRDTFLPGLRCCRGDCRPDCRLGLVRPARGLVLELPLPVRRPSAAAVDGGK